LVVDRSASEKNEVARVNLGRLAEELCEDRIPQSHARFLKLAGNSFLCYRKRLLSDFHQRLLGQKVGGPVGLHVVFDPTTASRQFT
jgi:hypothetical protein